MFCHGVSSIRRDNSTWIDPGNICFPDIFWNPKNLSSTEIFPMIFYMKYLSIFYLNKLRIKPKYWATFALPSVIWKKLKIKPFCSSRPNYVFHLPINIFNNDYFNPTSSGLNFWALTIFIPDDHVLPAHVRGLEAEPFLGILGHIFINTLLEHLLFITILENLIFNCHYVSIFTDKDREGLLSLDLVLKSNILNELSQNCKLI